MHSRELADKILEISEALSSNRLKGDDLRVAILEMGPACVFDDMENEEQVKGAMKVLNWLYSK